MALPFTLPPMDRDLLRFRSHGRQASIPRTLMGISDQIPPAPAVFDWSKGESIKYPIAGNDRYGDCYYVACANGSQTYTGNAGEEKEFDTAALTKRYLKISGGDNGLGDHQMMPEWKRGIVGPDGPRKIVDEMTVNINDREAIDLALWVFCGLVWTCSLLRNWLPGNVNAGDTWTNNSPRQRNAGHAMWISGKNAKGGYDVRTWGLSPPINLTYSGLMAADSELIVAFSMDMFNPAGVAPCGANFEQCATLWTQLGGQSLPPNPFPPAPPKDWFLI